MYTCFTVWNKTGYPWDSLIYQVLTGNVTEEDFFQGRRSLTFACISEFNTERHPKVERLHYFRDRDVANAIHKVELVWNIEGLVGVIKFGDKFFVVNQRDGQIRASEEDLDILLDE